MKWIRRLIFGRGSELDPDAIPWELREDDRT